MRRPFVAFAILMSVGCGQSAEPSPTLETEAGTVVDSAGPDVLDTFDTTALDTTVADTADALVPLDTRVDDTTVADTSKPPLLFDDFEAHVAGAPWVDGKTYGVWRSSSIGYGETVIAVDGSKTLSEKPQASTKLDETHASLVLSNVVIKVDFDLTLRMRTVAQLRTPTPNAWEVAWIVWHYTDEGHFYYFTPKPNGWELAKVDASKKDPSGPACVWPTYANCKYPGGQRYLATGSKPTFPVGAWYRVHVRQVGHTMSVSIDDVDVASFTDAETPYESGSIGLYNEDAHVRFDDVLVTAR